MTEPTVRGLGPAVHICLSVLAVANTLALLRLAQVVVDEVGHGGDVTEVHFFGGVAGLLGLVCLLGIWRRRRWGALGYGAWWCSRPARRSRSRRRRTRSWGRCSPTSS